MFCNLITSFLLPAKENVSLFDWSFFPQRPSPQELKLRLLLRHPEGDHSAQKRTLNYNSFFSCYPCQSAEQRLWPILSGGGAHYRGRRKQTLISSLLTFGRLLIIPVSTLGCEARRRKNRTHAETKIGSKEYLFNSRLNGNPCWILSTKYVNLQACYICKTAPLLGSTFEDFCTFAIQRCN